MAITAKQRIALELLTCGQGIDLKEIAARADVSPKTLWSWRNSPKYAEFQAELQKRNDERWAAAVDAAREAAVKLCKEGNQKMVEFILKNEGYNPTNKVEGNITTEINIVIGDEDDENN